MITKAPDSWANCTNGSCCDPASLTCIPDCPVCAANTHCVPGATCGTGTCVLNDQTPDVTGSMKVQRTAEGYTISDLRVEANLQTLKSNEEKRDQS